MTFDFVLGTVGEFIEYAQIIVAIFFVYYIWKFFTFEGPDAGERRTAEEARIQGARDWIGERHRAHGERRAAEETTRQATQAQHRRERLLGRARRMLMDMETHADHAGDELRTRDDAHLNRARNHCQRIQRELRSVRNLFRGASTTAHRDDRGYVRKLIAYVDLMENLFQNAIEARLPANALATDWDAQIAIIQSALHELINRCGILAGSIDQFVEHETRTAPGLPAPTPPFS
ncbi:hypothetical protein HZC30_04180 [Candidatus Woesearchaeota archaeon]|nr:hypothetical protein [Candidatus Woesearchaeota archaeon]